MRLAWLAAALLASACAKMDADMLAAGGSVRVEPHPSGSGVRVSILSVPDAPISLSPADPNREEGQRAIIAALIGDACAAQATVEARISLAPTVVGYRREQVFYRAPCSGTAAGPRS